MLWQIWRRTWHMIWLMMMQSNARDVEYSCKYSDSVFGIPKFMVTKHSDIHSTEYIWWPNIWLPEYLNTWIFDISGCNFRMTAESDNYDDRRTWKCISSYFLRQKRFPRIYCATSVQPPGRTTAFCPCIYCCSPYHVIFSIFLTLSLLSAASSVAFLRFLPAPELLS